MTTYPNDFLTVWNMADNEVWLRVLLAPRLPGALFWNFEKKIKF
jgi:hypothetical protein